MILILVLLATFGTKTTQMKDEADDDNREIVFTNRVSNRLVSPEDMKNVTMKTVNVANKIHCAFACVNENWCNSANFEVTPGNRKLHKCELLSIDGDNHPDALKRDEGYIHMYKPSHNPCNKNPCLNGGVCKISSRKQDYICQCRKGYDGKKCQKGGLQTSFIIFDHGNSSYIETLSSYLAPVLQSSSTSHWVRCWHAASDGWDVTTTFHPQCDHRGPTVTIVRVGSYVFGGYTDASWHSGGDFSASSRSFLYSLYNTNGYQPVKMSLSGLSNNNAIYGGKNYGPTFGSGYDLFISNQAVNNRDSYSQFSSYSPIKGCNLRVHCSVLAGSGFFTPNDIEVFYETTVQALQSYRTAAITEKCCFWFPGHVLVLPNNMDKIKRKVSEVTNELGCYFDCMKENWCYSANFRTMSDKKDLYMCEMLSTDKYSNPQYLTKSMEVTHLSVEVLHNQCKIKPCMNDGKCVFIGKRQGYRCQCKKGYDGNECQNEGLQTSSILRNHVTYQKTLSSYLTPVLQNRSTSRWVRCWRAASDGWDVTTTFHPQCDGKGPTVTIVRVGKYIFGGYSDVSWDSYTGYSSSIKAFLFSLHNINGCQPIKISLTSLPNKFAIFRARDKGPTFGGGHDLQISNLASSNERSFARCNSYQTPPGCQDSRSCSFYAGSDYFSPSDVEVFYETT